MKGFHDFWTINKIAIKNSIKPFFSFLIAFSVVLIVSPILRPLIYVETLNAFEKGDISSIYNSCIIAMTIITIMLIVSFFLNVYGDSWITKIMNSGKLEVLRIYTRMNYGQIKNNYSYGEVQNTIESGISDNMIVWAKITVIVSKIVSIIFLTFLGLEVSYAFFIIVVLFFLLEIITFYISKRWVEYFAKEHEVLKGIRNNSIFNLVMNIENIAIDNMFDWQLNEYCETRMKINDSLNKSTFKVTKYRLISDVGAVIAKGLTVIITINAIQNGFVSAGIVSTVFLVIDSLRDSIVQMREDLISLQTIFIPSINLNQFLISENQKMEMAYTDVALIRAENISYSINGEKIFNSISFQLNKNQKIAIIGDNGSGKTTFIRCLLSLYSLDEGKVYYNEEYINSPNSISYIPNKNQLYNLSVLENIDLANDIESLELLDDMVEFVDTPISGLSDGEEKRVNIVRGINKGAKILIADEPFEGLDEVRKKEYTDYLFKKFDHVIIVTHDLKNLNQFDKVYKLERGILNQIT